VTDEATGSCSRCSSRRASTALRRRRRRRHRGQDGQVPGPAPPTHDSPTVDWWPRKGSSPPLSPPPPVLLLLARRGSRLTVWSWCPAAGSMPGPLRPVAVRTRRVPRGCTGRQLRRISPSSSSGSTASFDWRRISVSPNDRRRRNLFSCINTQKRVHCLLISKHPERTWKELLPIDIMNINIHDVYVLSRKRQKWVNRGRGGK